MRLLYPDYGSQERLLKLDILQAGSLIVENLRTYRHPVIVYLPPGAELRGGAWVVIDGQINAQQVIAAGHTTQLQSCVLPAVRCHSSSPHFQDIPWRL